MTYEINSCLTSVINSFLIYEREYEIVYRGFYKKDNVTVCLCLSMFDEHSDLFQSYLKEAIKMKIPHTLGYIHGHAEHRGQFGIVKILEDNNIHAWGKGAYYHDTVLEKFEKSLKNEKR